MGDELIAQMGLLLTQLRYSRRALEDIERSTARYTTAAFTGALSAGTRFGAPPMVGGALKVWVVNINDLAPGGGGPMEGLLGGIGRLFGGFFGGLAGGTISGVMLPVMLGRIERIVTIIDRIMARLGTGNANLADARAAPLGASATSAPPATPQAAVGTLATLNQVTEATKLFTGLLQAAGDPNEAAKTTPLKSEDAGRWLDMMRSADALIQNVTLLVKGLVLLLPELIGGIAYLFGKLDAIKLGIVELLQFILKEALLVRGIVLTVLFDTLAAAARLASDVIGILGMTIGDVIKSVFGIFDAAFDATLKAIEFLGMALGNTVDKFLKWMIESLFVTLETLGSTRVFKVLAFAIQSLPYILPPLIQLVRGERIFRSEQASLDEVKSLKLDMSAGLDPRARPLPSFPTTLLDDQAVKNLRNQLDSSKDATQKLTTELFDAVGKGVQRIGAAVEGAVADRVFSKALDAHTKTLQDRATTLAGALGSAQTAALKATAQPTGFETIAKAYESWLSSPVGLPALLESVNAFLKAEPATAETLPARTRPPPAISAPRASVEIDELVIELAPSPDRAPQGVVADVMRALQHQSGEEFLRAMAEMVHEMHERAMTVGLGSPLLQH